jgi:hypothetical protein
MKKKWLSVLIMAIFLVSGTIAAISSLHATPPKKKKKKKIYFCLLTPIDNGTHSHKYNPSPISTLILKSIKKSIKSHDPLFWIDSYSKNPKKAKKKLLKDLLKKRKRKNWVINKKGHRVPDNSRTTNNLLNITFDPGLSKNQKIDRIINKFMNPHNIDILVASQYLEDSSSSLIFIRIVVYHRKNRKIKSRNIRFKRNQLLCRDPIKKKTILCPKAHSEIAGTMENLLNI